MWLLPAPLALTFGEKKPQVLEPSTGYFLPRPESCDVGNGFEAVGRQGGVRSQGRD